jgi:sigma-B regulation protein RsbU (phosphoserine phosphatase)
MESLIPNEAFLSKIANDHNICISAYYKPSSELGGDFYDVLDIGNNSIGICVWDFAGHGVGAAINTFRLHGIINDRSKYDVAKPGEFLTEINKFLYKLLTPAQFATMFYGVLDTKKRVLNYSCASCPSPLLISLKDGRYKLIESKEFPLGIQDKSGFTSHEISVKEWDVMILYSDALTETEDDNEEFLRLEDLVEFILYKKKEHKDCYDALSIRNDIVDKFNEEFSKNLRDDLTLKVITFENCKVA